MLKIDDSFPDFNSIKEEEKTDKVYELLAITAAIKDDRTDKSNLTSDEKKIIEDLKANDIVHISKELEMFNPMSEKCILMDTKYSDMAMSPVAMMGMNLGNEMDPQERFSEIKENTIKNMKTNPIYFDGFKEYAQIIAKTQELAHANYGAFIDTNFDKKTDLQKKEISKVINANARGVIALSLIAEKNQENQLSSYILDANDLKEKLNLPQVKNLTETLTFVTLEDSIILAKEQAKPSPDLSRIPDNGNSSQRTGTGR